MKNAIKQSITKSMDSLHASEDTYEEVMEMVNKNTRRQAPRGAWSWAKVAAVALAAVLVIGTGAYATATGWFANMFGTHGYTDVEPEDHGKGVQYFDVSEEAVAALVGDKFNNVGQTIEHDGYVLTVHGYVVDENGCAIGWATLSNENGIDTAYIQADGHLFKTDMIGPDEEGPFQYVVMTASDGNYVNEVDNGVDSTGHSDNHAVAVNRATATDTSLDLVFYYVSGDGNAPGGIEFRMGFCDDAQDTTSTIVKTDSFAVANVLDAVECGSFSVTPISIKGGLAGTIHNLSITYADGTEQLIENDYYYNVVLDNGSLYMPTALLNTNELASVNLTVRNADSTVSDYVFTPAE